MLANYNIRDDYYIERYFEEKDLSEFTEEAYEKDLIKFCKAVKKPLKNIIEECKAQQGIETEEILSSNTNDGNHVIKKRVIKFDVDGSDSLVLQYFNQFVRYCKSKGNKNTTINSGLDTIRAVLSKFKVELPNFPNLNDDTANWEVLSKEDFKFILSDSSLMHKSLILFMLSTGFRIYDCLNLTIGEYMKATSDFHDFVEVDDFIDNAPDDMRGYWDFEPHKTEKKHTLCRTFNSEESNKFILQNLRRLKNEYMPRKSKKIKKELKFTKSYPLFGSKRGRYEKSPTVQSISTMFGRKNKELYVWHINKINQNIKEGKISAEDYDKHVDLIPKFHPHACRKYFCTMIERHTSNERRYRLMEGHAPKNKLDKSYVDISKDEIKEVYDEAVVDLSIYMDANEDIAKLRDDFNQQLEEERKKHEAERKKEKEENQRLREQLVNLQEQANQTQEQVNELKIIRSNSKIEKTVNDFLKTNYKDLINDKSTDRHKYLKIQKVARDLAIKDKSNFRDEEEYLNSIIKKAIVKYTLNPDISIFNKKSLTYDELEKLTKHVSLQGELRTLIRSDNTLWDMVKENEIKLTHLIGYVINKNLDNIDNLTKEDKQNMVHDVLIEYLTVD